MEIKVSIVGLGRVGSVFYDRIVEKQGQGVRVVAVADRHDDLPAVRDARRRGIAVHKDGLELVAFADKIDIIFDLTGCAGFREKLRGALAVTGNRHTVVAPEVVASLIWVLVGSEQVLPDVHAVKGY